MNVIHSKDGVVLVAGASSGLGRRTAEILVERGYRVAGAARRFEQIAELAGVLPVEMDLSDDTSIRDATERVNSEMGPVHTLINSAGFGLFGSLEETPLIDARRQFDVNVFGLMTLTKLVLGPMRENGSGRVVNVSSLAGEFSSPFGGWYHASKFALEALSDSLRAELRPFGIDVVVVQPGPVRTPWHDDALARLESASGRGPYRDMVAATAEYHRRAQDSPITSDVDTAANIIVTAATSSRPRTRYRVGRGSTLAVAMSRLPDRVFDAMTRKQFGLS